jgi:hypothetical protein
VAAPGTASRSCPARTPLQTGTGSTEAVDINKITTMPET